MAFNDTFKASYLNEPQIKNQRTYFLVTLDWNSRIVTTSTTFMLFKIQHSARIVDVLPRVQPRRVQPWSITTLTRSEKKVITPAMLLNRALPLPLLEPLPLPLLLMLMLNITSTRNKYSIRTVFFL